MATAYIGSRASQSLTRTRLPLALQQNVMATWACNVRGSNRKPSFDRLPPLLRLQRQPLRQSASWVAAASSPSTAASDRHGSGAFGVVCRAKLSHTCRMPPQRPPRRQACMHAEVVSGNSSSGSSEPSGSSCFSGQNVVRLLRERGLIADLTSPDLEKLAESTALKIYCGFDPTADSLHLGNLLGILVLAWFQR